jgi:hypothetical protein
LDIHTGTKRAEIKHKSIYRFVIVLEF